MTTTPAKALPGVPGASREGFEGEPAMPRVRLVCVVPITPHGIRYGPGDSIIVAPDLAEHLLQRGAVRLPTLLLDLSTMVITDMRFASGMASNTT